MVYWRGHAGLLLRFSNSLVNGYIAGRLDYSFLLLIRLDKMTLLNRAFCPQFNAFS